MTIDRKVETRMFPGEARAVAGGEGIAVLTGRPVVFSSVTDLGWFDEVIEPGALDGADLRDVRLLINHDTRMIPLARSRRNNGNSTMMLSVDQQGLKIDFANLDVENNVNARALASAVERGDLSGMSFMFTVDSDRWDDLESDHPTRHILKISSIFEVSCVTFPAYEATSVSIQADAANVLESARAAALESAEQADAEPVETGENNQRAKELELLELEKEKTKILIGGKTNEQT